MAKAQALSDEDVALKIVELYFEEIARLGIKRLLDLDSIINSYYYTLSRIVKKEQELETAAKAVKCEEKKIATETKKELISEPAE